jgi:hypothetical protein
MAATIISRIEYGNGRPDLDKALEQKVGPAAEVALHRAGRHADHRRAERQDQAEQHRDAEAVDHPRHHVARLVVGAEPVPVAERAVHVRRALRIARAARLLVVQPGGFCRRGLGNLIVVGAIGITDGRPDHPTIRLDLILDHRVAVVSHREEATELFLRVIDDDREQQLALVGSEHRLVVGDEFGEQRQHEQHEKNPERPVAAAVRPKIGPAPLVERRQFWPLGGSDVFGDSRHQTSLFSKSMRGSIQV